MRLKKTIVIFVMFLFLFLSSIIVYAASNYNIEVVDGPSYYLYRQEKDPARYYYYINISLENTGTEKSTPIDLHIYEDGKKSVGCDNCKDVIFEPNEEKTFTIEYMTSSYQKSIEIKYKPSKSNVIETDSNSASITLIINGKNTNDNTPGFQVFSFIIVVFALILYKKIKK